MNNFFYITQIKQEVMINMYIDRTYCCEKYEIHIILRFIDKNYYIVFYVKFVLKLFLKL